MNSTSIQGPWRFQGSFTPPGDKSVSHRALMLGALSEGQSVYTNFLEAQDVLHTLQAFQSMGIPVILEKGKGKVSIQGKGLRGLTASKGDLYIGNSGTTMRLLLGILSGQRFEAILAGDDSLSKRPMKRITEPLKKMGAQIKGRDRANFAPLTIRGGKLQGIDFENKLASAQVKSAVLFAGLFAEGKTRVHEMIPSRDHTERFLKAAGAPFYQEGQTLTIEQTERLKPITATIPGDISSAAFFIVGAAMTPGSELTIQNVGLNPTRTGILNVLKRMGAQIEIQTTQSDPEPLGIIHIQGQTLKGTRISKQEIPSLVDELPILMTAMALAEGESLVSGAEELRVKETDRLHSMVTNLNAIGAKVQELPDGCVIRGVERFKPAKVKSFGDHRTVMSMAIASASMNGAVEVDDTSSVATSFPSFFESFQSLKEVTK